MKVTDAPIEKIICYQLDMKQGQFMQEELNLVLNGGSLKPADKFPYLGSSVSSTENDISTRLAKAWTANSHMEVRPVR